MSSENKLLHLHSYAQLRLPGGGGKGVKKVEMKYFMDMVEKFWYFGNG